MMAASMNPFQIPYRYQAKLIVCGLTLVQSLTTQEGKTTGLIFILTPMEMKLIVQDIYGTLLEPSKPLLIRKNLALKLPGAIHYPTASAITCRYVLDCE